MDINPSVVRQIFEEVVQTARRLVSDHFQTDKEALLAKVELLRTTFRPELLTYALEQYTSSELDLLQMGDRGLGRMGREIPRLGPYLAGRLGYPNQGQNDIVCKAMLHLIIAAYLGASMAMPEVHSADLLPEKLFLRWIPSIYVSSSLGGEVMRTWVEGFANPYLDAMVSAIRDLGGTTASTFEEAELQLKGILYYYTIAGVCLQLATLTPPKEKSLNENERKIIDKANAFVANFKKGPQGCALVFALAIATTSLSYFLTS